LRSAGSWTPVIHITNGAANISANAAANPLTNGLHLAAFVLATFMLPVSVIGTARLAISRSPWLATIGGALGLVGWLPFSALTAQEDLTLQMMQIGPNDLVGTLWERFQQRCDDDFLSGGLRPGPPGGVRGSGDRASPLG
jgi:hypothetical protein